jgi:hypothetical protein
MPRKTVKKNRFNVKEEGKRADLKKKPTKATTKVASATTQKAVKPAAPAAKKSNDLCKPDKDGKLPKDCKVEAAAKPKAKPAETASATN